MNNQVILTGKIANDCELKYVGANKLPYISFTIAVKRDTKTEGKEARTDFIRCSVWREKAEEFSQFANKGQSIQLKGRLTVDKNETNGEVKYYTTVVAYEILKMIEPQF